MKLQKPAYHTLYNLMKIHDTITYLEHQDCDVNRYKDRANDLFIHQIYAQLHRQIELVKDNTLALDLLSNANLDDYTLIIYDSLNLLKNWHVIDNANPEFAIAVQQNFEFKVM